MDMIDEICKLVPSRRLLLFVIQIQGVYRVKFLVDGEWRLAPEW